MLNISSDGEVAGNYFVESNTGYLFATLHSVVRLKKTASIYLNYENTIDGTARTIGSGSSVYYRLIKLCDLP